MPLISFDPDKAAPPIEELLKKGSGKHMMEERGNSKYYIHVLEGSDFEFSVEEHGKTVPSVSYYISVQQLEHDEHKTPTHGTERKKGPPSKGPRPKCYYCVAGPGGMVCTQTTCI